MATIISVAVILIIALLLVGFMRSDDMEWKYIALLLAFAVMCGVFLKAQSDYEWETYQRGYEQATYDVYEKYYEEGYEAGYNDGYMNGYNDGFEEGEE